MNKANDMTHIPEGMLADEAVQYICERHHVTARDLLSEYGGQKHGQTGCGTGAGHTHLEENEKRIIRDLIHMYDKEEQVCREGNF